MKNDKPYCPFCGDEKTLWCEGYEDCRGERGHGWIECEVCGACGPSVEVKHGGIDELSELAWKRFGERVLK